jgi:uncharacterized protein
MPENSAVPPSQPLPPPPTAPPANPSEARTWNMLCHLSTLSGYIIPFGNIIGPLLVWQIQKQKFPSVEEHGKAALNFQLTVLIVLIPAIIATFLLSFFCVGVLLVPVDVAVALCGVIFPIIAGVKANNGEPYRYPWSLTLIS